MSSDLLKINNVLPTGNKTTKNHPRPQKRKPKTKQSAQVDAVVQFVHLGLWQSNGRNDPFFSALFVRLRMSPTWNYLSTHVCLFCILQRWIGSDSNIAMEQPSMCHCVWKSLHILRPDSGIVLLPKIEWNWTTTWSWLKKNTYWDY